MDRDRVRAALAFDEPRYERAALDLGVEALPVLAELVVGDDRRLASRAAYLASLLPHEDAVKVVDLAASSGYPEVRVAAASALRNIPMREPSDGAFLLRSTWNRLDGLILKLSADPDAGVRKVLARSTGIRPDDLPDSGVEVWIGVVSEVDVDGGVFIAEIVEPSSDLPREETWFDVNEVHATQRAAIRPGAIFRWQTSLEKGPDLRLYRQSSLRFESLPEPTFEDVQAGASLVASMARVFDTPLAV